MKKRSPHHWIRLRRIAFVGLAPLAATALLLIGVISASAGTGQAGNRVTLCHATGSATNPFVKITVDAAGAFNGHLGHQDGRDIIPPFTFNGQTFSQNWPSGQATFNNGCVAPGPPVTPTTPPTSPPRPPTVPSQAQATAPRGVTAGPRLTG
jgi:hypothetical protein